MSSEERSIQDRVNTICNELYASGQKISVRIVLSKLPDISSTSTIHKYFKQWRDELEANQKSLLEKMGFSEKFTSVFMEEITRHAAEAEKRYREIAQNAKEQAREAIEDLERAEERLHKQTALLEQKEKEIGLLKDNVAQNKKAHEAVVIELRQQIESLSKLNNELSSSKEHLLIDVAKAELKLESNQKLVAAVESQNDELVTENKRLNQVVVDKSSAIVKHEATETWHLELISELKKEQENLQQVHQKAANAESKLISNQELISSIKDQNSELTTENKRLNQVVVDKSSAIIKHEAIESGHLELINELKKDQINLLSIDKRLTEINLASERGSSNGGKKR